MKQLILNSATTLQQKIILIGFGLITLIVGGLTLLWFIFYFLEKVEYSEVGVFDIILLILFFFSFFLFSAALSKEGLIIAKDEVFKSFFLFKKSVKKTKIDLNGVSDISILKFNVARKVATWTSVNPEQTQDYTDFRVYGLNASHSKRTLIYNAQSKEQAKLIVNAMVSDLGLNYVAYNPPRSKNRKR